MPSINDNPATADLDLIQNRNISKLFDSEDNPLVPSAYEIEEFNIFNIYGEEKSIKRLVTSFNVVEELFSPVIICNINIRDDENLFEEFLLQAQEKIQFNIKLRPLPGEPAQAKEVILEFYIKEFPNFRKTTEAINIQEYNIVAISTFAYISQLTKISRAVPNPVGEESDGNPLIEIKEIFEKNLLFSPIAYTQLASTIKSFFSKFGAIGAYGVKALDKIEDSLNSSFAESHNHLPNYIMIKNDKYDAINKFKGNITLRSPLAAVEFLRTKAYDINLTPFFVYNKIGAASGVSNKITGDVVIVESLTSLMDEDYNPIYYANNDEVPYNYTPGFLNQSGNSKDNKPGRPKYYKELKKRILNVDATLNINKLKQANSGVYGSRVEIFDYTMKDYLAKDYDPYKEPTTKDGGLGILPEFASAETRPFGNMWFGDDQEEKIELGGDNVDEPKIIKYNVSGLHLPPKQCEEDEANGLFTAPETYAMALNKAKYYYSRLQDDRNIEIELYGDFSLNPGTRIELTFPKSLADTDSEDEIISGIYLIVAAIHQFNQGLYTSKLKLVKLVKE